MLDLVARLLEYTPTARLSAIEAMCHPLFHELRQEETTMPSGKPMPALFDFTREGEHYTTVPNIYNTWDGLKLPPYGERASRDWGKRGCAGEGSGRTAWRSVPTPIRSLLVS
jgi:serine/threonine protein kinase